MERQKKVLKNLNHFFLNDWSPGSLMTSDNKVVCSRDEVFYKFNLLLNVWNIQFDFLLTKMRFKFIIFHRNLQKKQVFQTKHFCFIGERRKEKKENSLIDDSMKQIVLVSKRFARWTDVKEEKNRAKNIVSDTKKNRRLESGFIKDATKNAS